MPRSRMAPALGRTGDTSIKYASGDRVPQCAVAQGTAIERASFRRFLASVDCPRWLTLKRQCARRTAPGSR